MVAVYSLDGKTKKEAKLPPVFREDVRPDLIKRAVISSQSARYQPYGPDWYAGKRTSAFSWGPGRGVSRVPRVKGSRYPRGGAGAIVPQAVKGRRAHPPKVEKVIRKKMNRKERLKALRSAIAATASAEMVKARGHRTGLKEFPAVVEEDFEAVKSTREVRELFMKMGLWEDVERAKDGRTIRAGRGKMRGRRYKNRRSVLVVVAEDRGIGAGARNLPGVDVVTADGLSCEDLAPGTHPGRLALYTTSALKRLEERF
ncbi:MAG: 50S ribosomal protein L4 [Euryarchaeota archaeon]|nr:50S ribosomal protein L4 [Euryarchaeota archaeon]